jgi:hypothetical protein
MKLLSLFVCFAFSGTVFAQDLEERNDLSLENSKNINQLIVKEPFYQLAVKGCNNLHQAEFPGGMRVFKKTLSNFMYDYLNSDMYKLNGDFSFVVTIDENGKITEVVGHPAVPNSKYFFEDMQYVFRRIKQNWTPASCDGKPISSQLKINIHFNSMSIDI